jgi:outer membrane protein OmpA-like peptidoglycan-associated protein
MEHEDYLDCIEYEGKPSHPTNQGFVAFFHEKSSRYFFALLDGESKVLLKSEGYPKAAARENGIQSVKKNRTKRDNYSVKKRRDGTYYLSLKAANHREIARSCNCSSEAEALALIPYLTGETKRAAKTVRAPEGDRQEDNYLVCREYRGHAGIRTEYAGLAKFTHKNGQHYFVWYDDKGEVLMRSEGYATTTARDNGMASVAKNRDNGERYSIEQAHDVYFVVLKAGNRQEIARSCPLESEAVARALFPSEKSPAHSSQPPEMRFKNILFVPDSTEFMPDSIAILNGAMATLQAHPAVRIEIGGHTDNVNTEEHNLSLSQRRADAVREYLITHGILPDRLIAVGYGALRPIDDNNTAEGRWHNRRIEFSVVK